MAKLRIGLALLAAITLGLSLAIPGVDAPETSYDESESLPYENTPAFTEVALLSVSPMALSRILAPLSVLTSSHLTTLSFQRPEHPLQNTAPEILTHSLRC